MPSEYFTDKKICFSWALDQPLVARILEFCGNGGVQWEGICVEVDERAEESIGSN
jgi:hypothetical protein